MEGLKLQRAWQRSDHAQSMDAVAFWLRHGALPSNEAWRRTSELVALARQSNTADSEAAAIGISTAIVADCPPLGVPMYYLRMFIAPRHRHPEVARELLAESVRILAPRGRLHASDAPCGVWLEMQNPKIDRAIRDLVWRVREFDFVYIGCSPEGLASRVCYFPRARLPHPDERR
ncbi:hypothetical protein [Nevskia sp.]|uniref:hypothetical protein n=1 Tax=Nevskia sp. TaxID=1929292 RepID=UPI0025E14E24|nr:hypothetical protein [Nevskia sp.]